MDRKEILRMVIDYKESKNEGIFNQLYVTLRSILKPKMEYDVRVQKFDEHDITALYDDTLMEAINYFTESMGCFMTVLYTKIKSRKIDLLRKSKRRIPPSEGKDEDSRTYQMVDISEADVAETADRRRVETPEEIVTKKRDQRQLISFLVARQDDFTLKVAEMIPNAVTPNALAKELGVHHSKVSRSLERLRNRYDANRFGDIRDYLAV